MAKATIIQSAVLKIANNLHRPAPSIFYYPGLSSPSPLLPNTLFPEITNTLTTNYNLILQEYLNLGEQGISNDYVENNEHEQLHVGNWDWNSYISKGVRQASFAINCPKTTEILESFNPQIMTGTPFSYAFFSTLAGKSKIDPHTGPCNLRIRCHFPLIVPTNGECKMDIGSETVVWKENEPVFFDDCYLHRVSNDSDDKRVVLLFDVWHPDLMIEEIIEIKSMFDNRNTQG